MDVPSISLSVHRRDSPEIRDRIVEKLRTARVAVDSEIYRLLSPPALRRLAEFISRKAPVVSCYLQLGPERRVGGGWHTVFSSLADSTLRRIDDPRERRRMKSEFDRIEAALGNELPVLGRGAAFFVCEPMGLWRQYAVPVPLPDGIHLGRQPYLRPLVRTRDEHDRFVLAVLSVEHSRFFVSQIGQVEEVFRVRGQRLRHILTDRVASDRRDVIVTKAMKNEAKVLAHAAELVLAEFEGRYLLTSSAPELHAAVVQHLPKAVQRLGGEFSVDPHADLRGFAAAAEPAQRAIEEREETATVERIREAGPAAAAWGESRTLDALREDRVMLLAVDDMFAKPGARCATCGGMWDYVPTRCPICGSDVVEAVEDVVELALEQALEQKAGLEIVRSSRARQLMADLGRMTALLRW